jgi:predicted DNA-binding transcriptional regulator YafY
VSQKEMRGGKYASDAMPYVFQVRVFPSYDFYQKLMSLEPSIEVLEPQEVRDEMASRLSESMKLYKSNNPKIK